MAKKKGILVILFILLIGLFISPKSVRADENRYKLEVDYGIEGSYKSGRYIPFRIKITPEEDFVGEVEIRVKSNEGEAVYDAFSKEISVEASKGAEVLIPVTIQEGHGSVQVNLINKDGKIKAKKDLNITNGRINEYTLSVGLLTEDKTALGYVSSVALNDGAGTINSVKTTALTEDYLNDKGLLIDSLDVIIVNNYNLANLNEENYNALKLWVEKGGELIIGSGANEGKTIKNISGNFLKIETSGVKDETVNLSGKSLNLINSNITLEGSDDLILEGSSKTLAYSLTKGRGKVIVTTFDLGLEPFISSGIETKVMEGLLKNSFDKLNNNYKHGYNMGYYELESMVNSIPVGKITDVKVIFIIVLIYAIVVGFGVYIVLKKLKKSDLTWIVIPVLALVFSGTIYLFGKTIKFEEIILNKTNVITIDKNGVGNLTGYLGISSDKKENVEIETKSNTITLLNRGYYYGDIQNSSYKTLSLKTSYKEDSLKYTIGREKSLNNTAFSIEAGEIILDSFDYNLKVEENGLNGSITNKLSYDMENVLVIFSNSIWDIGTLKANETKEILDLKAASYSGIEEYTRINLEDKYYNARYQGIGDPLAEENKNILSKANLLRSMTYSGVLNNKPQIIAISGMPMEYDIDFKGKSISNFDKTLILQEISMDFKDENGVYNYPEGYFVPEYHYDMTKELYFDSYSNYFNGKGEVELYYYLDKGINFEEINLRIQNINDYSNGAGAILNIKTNEFEDITFGKEKLKIETLENYLDENNKLTIKLYVDDMKGSSEVPLVSAKGREK